MEEVLGTRRARERATWGSRNHKRSGLSKLLVQSNRKRSLESTDHVQEGCQELLHSPKGSRDGLVDRKLGDLQDDRLDLRQQ